MTIKELYELAVKNNCENLELHVQYRDAGGDYEGTEVVEEVNIKKDRVII